MLFRSGCWFSCNGLTYDELLPKFKKEITVSDFNTLAKIYTNVMNPRDLLEDLMYKILCLIDAAKNKSHRILIFNTIEDLIDYHVDDPEFALFKQRKEIIGGFQWRSNPWQFEQGATYIPEDEPYPLACRHIVPGQHHWLNEFLTNYIKEHKILQ